MTKWAFHADLRPDHLLALPDGRLGIAGCGTVGRLDPATRRAALDYLNAVLGGGFDGQVSAVGATGAVSESVDVDRLVAHLAAAGALQPMTILACGVTSLLGAVREAMKLLLLHRLLPPPVIVLLIRTLFKPSSQIKIVNPDRSLLDALLTLIARRPELRTEEER